MFAALSVSQAQLSSPAPAPLSSSLETVPAAPPSEAPKPVATPALSAKMGDGSSMMLVQAATAPAPTVAPVASANEPEAAPAADSGGVAVREFQGDDVGQVLRLLARQAKVNMVVSEAVVGTVTMRLEDVTALQAVEIIAKSKSLFVDKIDGVYYVKTAAERTAEPTEGDSYQFSYARAKETAELVAAQLASKDAPQVDERTNTIFFRETRSNIENIRKLLVQIDRPTKQVMIEARLVEVNANPRQSYGINWAGVVGGSSSPKTLNFGGSTLGTNQLVPAQDVVGRQPRRNAPSYAALDANGIPVQGTNAGILARCDQSTPGFPRSAGWRRGQCDRRTVRHPDRSRRCP